MEKVYITKEQRRLIASTSPKDCWICALLSDNVQKDSRGLFIPGKVFTDDGIIEHLDQIIERK